MQASDVTGASSASAASSSAAASAALTSDFNTFIQLLTTQVTNQDPLEPLDSTQFVEQLATFSGLEQQIATNSHLEAIASLLQSSLGSDASLIGEYVAAPAIKASGPFNALGITADAEEGALIVKNSADEEVYRGPVTDEWTWSGLDTGGNAVPLDTYTFEISTPDGNVSAQAVGQVDRIVATADGQLVGLGEGVFASAYGTL